jgi:CBS-domain-containing membrane protein
MFFLQHSLRSVGLASSTALAMSGTPKVILVAPFVEAAIVLIVAVPMLLLAGPYAFIGALAIAALAASNCSTYVLGRVALDRPMARRLVAAGLALSACSACLWAALMSWCHLYGVVTLHMVKESIKIA